MHNAIIFLKSEKARVVINTSSHSWWHSLGQNWLDIQATKQQIYLNQSSNPGPLLRELIPQTIGHRTWKPSECDSPAQQVTAFPASSSAIPAALTFSFHF